VAHTFHCDIALSGLDVLDLVEGGYAEYDAAELASHFHEQYLCHNSSRIVFAR
jgi:hypothetical protein